MSIAIDGRNQQYLARGHNAMCHCKMYTHSADLSLLAELSKVANEAWDHCLDAPDMVPSGGMTEYEYGPYGWFQRLLPRGA